MMWIKRPENNIKNLYGSFLKQYFECHADYTGCKKNLQLPDMLRRNSLSAVEDEIGTETESEPEERIRSAPLIEKFPEQIFRTTQLIFSFEDGKIISRLREPKHLYAMAQSMGEQNKALWPSELQVKIECIEHKQLPPDEPEPFYQQTGEEPIPMIRADLPHSQVVYQYDTNICSFFISSCRANKTDTKCCVNQDVVDENTLLFESRFESGNLAKAVQVGESDYELYVHCDLYTQKHTQWYYFQVSNTRKNIPYRFTIVNFLKKDSLYNYGMKPLMYSEKAASDPVQPKGWHRIGDEIKYYRNNLRYENSDREQTFYSLTWLFEFDYDEDTVYFAHCYPYTYTDLQTYLIKCINDPQKSKFFTQRILCKTLAGNNIYILTITNPCQDQGDGKPKRAVVMTARVHPGESNASWMMKGFLDFITSDSPDAQVLRDNFVFKVVPMLNPDGVIIGNYRCSLSGQDLNRNYKTLMKESFPPVWNIRNMVKKLLTKREVLIYCDLHGHSRKHNMFMYGCENRSKSNQSKFLQERIFPLLLSRNAPDKFKFESCKFKIKRKKEGTGRVIMWNMGIINSFTLEASFCGSTLGSRKGMHFNTEDYESMGHTFCETILNYLEPDKFTYLSNELKEYLSSYILSKWQQKGMSIDNITISKEDMLISESSDAGSDSSDSDELLEFFQLHQFPKKKKLKTKTQRDKKLKGSKSPEKKSKQQKKLLFETQDKGDNHPNQIRQHSTELIVKGSSKSLKSHIGENHKKMAFNCKLSQNKQSQSNINLSDIHSDKKESNFQVSDINLSDIHWDKKERNFQVSDINLSDIHWDKKGRNFQIKTCMKCGIKDSSAFSDGNLTNQMTKSFSVDICDGKTETLLESYLNNIGVLKKGKKRIPETPNHFLQTLTEPSVCFAKPKKTVRQSSCPAWTENRLQSKFQ